MIALAHSLDTTLWSHTPQSTGIATLNAWYTTDLLWVACTDHNFTVHIKTHLDCRCRTSLVHFPTSLAPLSSVSLEAFYSFPMNANRPMPTITLHNDNPELLLAESTQVNKPQSTAKAIPSSKTGCSYCSYPNGHAWTCRSNTRSPLKRK